MNPSRQQMSSKSFHASAQTHNAMSLRDGSRIAVIGGGPAGSFFAFFLLRLARRIALNIDIDIYEPRHFVHPGPSGCNHCGGIVSESLVQMLAAEGINLPPSVVQRGIGAYVVHTDVGTVRIESARHEQRIAALYRGNGPRSSTTTDWESFDQHLLDLAHARGAHIVRELVNGITWRAGHPVLQSPDGEHDGYDLVVVASGVNSNLLQLVRRQSVAGAIPRTTRTYITEFQSDAETIRRTLGNSMHVYLLNLPRLEFAALIPKGEYVTLCLLGERIDDSLVTRFLDSPEVKTSFPCDVTPRVCNCSPFINVRPRTRPYADRVVFIGDAGVTRLYKDGIGAAYRTAKAAAETVALRGVGARDFKRHYWPTCRAIHFDNQIGRLIFAVTHAFKVVRPLRRGMLRMIAGEQRGDGPPRMSGVMWNLFTGSAPYQEIFRATLAPAFIVGLVRNVGAAFGRDHDGNGKNGGRHVSG